MRQDRGERRVVDIAPRQVAAAGPVVPLVAVGSRAWRWGGGRLRASPVYRAPAPRPHPGELGRQAIVVQRAGERPPGFNAANAGLGSRTPGPPPSPATLRSPAARRLQSGLPPPAWSALPYGRTPSLQGKVEGSVAAASAVAHHLRSPISSALEHSAHVAYAGAMADVRMKPRRSIEEGSPDFGRICLG